MASTGPGVSCTLRLPITFPDAYEREDSTTASVPATAHQPPDGIDAREDGDTDEADRDPGDLQPTKCSWGRKRQPEQEREDRHGRLCDRGDTRVDVLLSPGHEPERDRRPDGADRQARPPRGAQLGRRAAAPMVAAR